MDKILAYSIGVHDLSEHDLSLVDWRKYARFAKKQTLLGVVFDGISKLGSDRNVNIPRDVLLQWLMFSEQIKRRNMKLNHVAAVVYRQLRNAGYRCCILKGQGNALMYPNPYSRTPGDIDIWIPADRNVVKAACEFLINENIGLQARWLETRFYHYELEIGGVVVEVHCFPMIMNNPIHNSRLQGWFNRNADLQCSNIVCLPDDAGEIAVPTNSFNVIYQLAHLYHHFFDEGIGLRQMMDYYFVTAGRDKSCDETLCGTMKHLGLYKFAGAVMYVLHEVFGLKFEEMIVPADIRRGKVLQCEIYDGGNFGKDYEKYGAFTRQSVGKKHFLKIYRNMHFVALYPSEALSEPLFRTWHWFWRKFTDVR